MTGAGDLDQFSALVDKVYEGALDPAVWPRIIEPIAAWLRVKNALLFTPLNPQQTHGLLFSHGFSERTLELWRSKYCMLDVWTLAAVEGGLVWEGNCALGEDLVSERDLHTTPWYKEFLRPDDIPQLMTGVVFDGQTTGTLTTICSTFRGELQPRFDGSDLRRLRLLLPHLSRALGVMFHLRQADLRVAATLSALDRLATGVLLIAASGDVAFANRTAHRMAEADDGLRLEQRVGRGTYRLVVRNSGFQNHIDEAMRRCIQGNVLDVPHFGLSLRVPRPSGRSSYALQFSALPEQNEFSQGIDAPRAIIFLSDGNDAAGVDPGLLSNLYDLTPAEARLAAALIDGDELAETAARLKIGLNTAKTQLLSIYAKTGVENRAKLAKLLVSLAGPRS